MLAAQMAKNAKDIRAAFIAGHPATEWIAPMTFLRRR